MKRRTRIHRAIVEALENRRLLSFTAPVSYSVGSSPQGVATGDFNGDGRSDVVTTNAGSNNVSVLLSNANGTLQPAQQFATGTTPMSVAVGDVNNDGRRDIITANAGGNLSVLIGNGNGTFQSPLSVTLPNQMPPGYPGPTPLAQKPMSVAVGDLNADGKLDLVVSGHTTHYIPYYSPYGGRWDLPQNSGYLNVLVGNGHGTFAASTAYPAQGAPSMVAAADMNNDNKLDVITGYPDQALWLGNGNGTLQPRAAINNVYAPSFVIGDFDMDGKRDFVGVSSGLTFAKGNGNGTFQTPITVPVVGEVRSVVAGDVNGDGKLDLVVSTRQTTFASYGYYGGYNPTTTEYTKVLLGSGTGTFSRGVSSIVRSYAGYGASNTSALGDFNIDGRPDLVATDPANSKTYVQLNQPGWIVPGALAISDAAPVTEGHSGSVNAVFIVTLAEAPAANVTVDYSVIDGNATLAGGDFIANSGTLTFTPGQTTKTITVQVKGDRIGEGGESFSVLLANPVNADIIDASGSGFIVDDEPTVWITGSQVTEGNSGTTPLTFTVTISAPSDAPVVVNYRTVDSSAHGTTDFVPVASSVTIAPGQTTKTFTVQVKGDLVPEETEYFYANIISASNALPTFSMQGEGAIVDTDPNPTISIANVTRAEGPPGASTRFEFVVSLSKPSEKSVFVYYATASGTATSSGSNRDFRAQESSVNFYPGQMYASVEIEVLGDSRTEPDETFFINLSDANNATIADNQAVGTILNDETRGKTWIGPNGGSWSTASNWSPSGVPVATSFVHINNATVSLSSSITVAELSLGDLAALNVTPGGNKVVRTSAFFNDYATIDLNDNNLIVDYTAGNSPLGAWNVYGYIGVSGMIGYGSNGGLYNGWGIITTRPDALAGRTALAVGEASQVLGLAGTQNGLFSGQTVDATTILVKYTHRGDANLDGTLDIDDYTAIDYGISAHLTGWGNGDFNYDGKINIDDYLFIDGNISSQGSPMLNNVPTDVPSMVWERQPGEQRTAVAELFDTPRRPPA